LNNARKLGGKGDRLLLENVGKNITIFYNDTFSTVSSKKGRLLDFDLFGIKLLEDGKLDFTFIPRSKCIRIELGGGQIAAATTR
jgi:hypothetical protein